MRIHLFPLLKDKVTYINFLRVYLKKNLFESDSDKPEQVKRAPPIVARVKTLLYRRCRNKAGDYLIDYNLRSYLIGNSLVGYL